MYLKPDLRKHFENTSTLLCILESSFCYFCSLEYLTSIATGPCISLCHFIISLKGRISDNPVVSHYAITSEVILCNKMYIILV